MQKIFLRSVAGLILLLALYGAPTASAGKQSQRARESAGPGMRDRLDPFARGGSAPEKL